MDYVTPAMISVLKDAVKHLETKSGATRDVLEQILKIAYGVSEGKRKKIEIYVSQERLVSDLGWKKITIKRALRRLVQLGILLKVQQRRRRNGFFSTTLYHIVWDRLAEVLHVWSQSERVDKPSTEELKETSQKSLAEERVINAVCEVANSSETVVNRKQNGVLTVVQRVTNFVKDRETGKHNIGIVGSIDAKLIQTIIHQYGIKNAKEFERWVSKNVNRNVEQYLQWIRQCPANHTARPKHAWAWLRAAVREQWDMPSWMTQKAPSATPYQLYQPEKAESWTPPESLQGINWEETKAAVKEFLDDQKDPQAVQNFLEQVKVALTKIFGDGTRVAQQMTQRGVTFWSEACQVWHAQGGVVS